MLVVQHFQHSAHGPVKIHRRVIVNFQSFDFRIDRTIDIPVPKADVQNSFTEIPILSCPDRPNDLFYPGSQVSGIVTNGTGDPSPVIKCFELGKNMAFLTKNMRKTLTQPQLRIDDPVNFCADGSQLWKPLEVIPTKPVTGRLFLTLKFDQKLRKRGEAEYLLPFQDFEQSFVGLHCRDGNSCVAVAAEPSEHLFGGTSANFLESDGSSEPQYLLPRTAGTEQNRLGKRRLLGFSQFFGCIQHELLPELTEALAKIGGIKHQRQSNITSQTSQGDVLRGAMCKGEQVKWIQQTQKPRHVHWQSVARQSHLDTPTKPTFAFFGPRTAP
ncbi:MAG: hypothetical protein IPP17_17410 [Bacteroidetes bacterium]|nr:hypothetical protein [Bacteroidota bacterium]